tara:strand:- start:108555 stop:109979 length:1425 start_codon:yes stop_codon:yes gene_type:complete
VLLKYFYDDKLAHASYIVGCQRANAAVVVDPGRDIDPYLDFAKQEGLRLVAVAETHIHADYVSGARELAERVGAKLYVSDEGTEDWKYVYLDAYANEPLHDGDHFMIGKIKFDVVHTPGHTPESISFLVTDQGGGASEPMGIFTGDFVFVGSIGRPDLLQKAAGIADTARPSARDLYRSAQWFKQLPDYLQVWPAHGAGSACGKGLGAIPSSTVGYEKRFNPALQFTDEDEFVRYILADQPEAPKYFALMKRVNKEGPRILGANHTHKMLDMGELAGAISRGTVVDITASADYAKGHVPGTINIPVSMLATWAGWLVPYDQPVFLICEPDQLEEAARVLHKIGVEDIQGGFDVDAVQASAMATEVYSAATPAELARSIETGQVRLIDVRSDEEWNEGHIEQAEHVYLGRLPDHIDPWPRDQTIVVQCRSAARSAVAASVLQAAGFKSVVNLSGGYVAWKSAGLPSVKPADAVSA